MTSFETISLEDYKKLVYDEKKIFDLTKNFTTPEILNKYGYTDKNIDNKIKQKEIIKEKYENLDKITNKNIDQIKEKNQIKTLQPTIILQMIMMMMMINIFHI